MEDEQEQLDALKKWWSENGRTVTAGVVIGLGAMGGWNWWQSHAQAKQEAASAQFSTALNQVVSANATSDEDAKQAGEAAEQLMANDGSIYSTLAALLSARSALTAGDSDAAASSLRHAADKADNDAMRGLAHLRLARLLVASGDLDGASANLDAIASAAFGPLIDELRGDIEAARDAHDAARTHYRSALDNEQLTSDSQARLQLKLDALGAYSTPPQ